MKGEKMLEGKSKIYIGNLDYGVTEQDILSLLEEKGIKSQAAEVIMDKHTGRSKGFGFAVLESEEEIEKAIEALNGQDLKGRALNVSKANPPREGGQRRGGFGKGGPGRGGFGRGGGGGGGRGGFEGERSPRY